MNVKKLLNSINQAAQRRANDQGKPATSNPTEIPVPKNASSVEVENTDTQLETYRTNVLTLCIRLIKSKKDQDK
ncbi:hypothetical protein FH041_11605 [Pseudomonas sp. SWI7]|uniref:hypothetical protein n=1 Tax=Pseudomonas sp. SWI7 TaxID=2587597 RepID=UPI0011211FAA|nr:hypothetical protein [Pseudomonas sp. SWI7]QDC05524.1 hypothetical protein FH041_11605 [Pseudomonas sp. SWI7]